MRLLRLLLALSMAAPAACEDDAGPKGPSDAAADGPALSDAADGPGGDAGDTADAPGGDAGDAGDAPAEVAPDGPPVGAVVVTPANPSIVPGGSIQMQARAAHIDGSLSDVTTRATWTSSRPLTATVNSSGLVSALMTGETVISATFQGVVGSTSFTVTTVATTGITIAPASASLVRGATGMFTATLAFSNGTSQDITEMAQWSVDHPAIATVSNQTGQRGLVQAVAEGQTTLRAMSIGHTGTATVTVTAAP